MKPQPLDFLVIACQLFIVSYKSDPLDDSRDISHVEEIPRLSGSCFQVFADLLIEVHSCFNCMVKRFLGFWIYSWIHLAQMPLDNIGKYANYDRVIWLYY